MTPGLRRTLAQEQEGKLSPEVADARTRVAERVLISGIASFSALTALVRTRQLDAFDRAITVRLQAIDDPRFQRAMFAVSWFGFPPQSRLLPPAYAGILWIGRFRREAAFQLAAWGTALLSTVIKSFMQRPRPVAGTDLRVVATPLGGSSFPSGHVLTYVGVYGWMAIVADLLIRPVALRRVVVGALATLIAAIGPSRIYQGHHWPTDVAASYLLGSSYLAALVIVYRRLTTRGVSR